MSEKSSNKYAATTLSEVDFFRMLRTCTKKGMHPSDYVRDAILDKLLFDYECDSVGAMTKEDHVAMLDYQRRQKAIMMNQLRQLAYEAANSGDPEDYARLEEGCLVAGVDIGIVTNSITNYREAPSSEDSTSVASAMAWLTQFVEPGMERPVNVVMELGGERGFSENILREAKKKLGIVSERRSSNWVWLQPSTTKRLQ